MFGCDDETTQANACEVEKKRHVTEGGYAGMELHTRLACIAFRNEFICCTQWGQQACSWCIMGMASGSWHGTPGRCDFGIRHSAPQSWALGSKEGQANTARRQLAAAEALAQAGTPANNSSVGLCEVQEALLESDPAAFFRFSDRCQGGQQHTIYLSLEQQVQLFHQLLGSSEPPATPQPEQWPP